MPKSDSRLPLFCSLAEIPLSSELHTLNLHCNQISRIESLDHMLNLQHLDLSSNRIHWIEGLSSLANLCTLNLACNLITKVEGLEKLFNLTKLNLSYNRIHDLTGLLYLRGTNFKISHIELHSNCISNVNHLLQCLTGLQYLSNLSLEKNGKSNPVCAKIGYREILLQALPQLTILDGRNIFGEPVNFVEANSSDLKCLEGLLDCLASSSSPIDEEEACINLPVITPHIDKVLAQFHQHACLPTWPTSCSSPEVISSSEPERIKLDNDTRIKKLEDQISHLLEKITNSSKADIALNVLKAKRDTDLTSESGGESGKENRKVAKRSKFLNYRKAASSTKYHSQRDRTSDRAQEQTCVKSKNQRTQVKEKENSSPTSEAPSLDIVGKSLQNLGGQKNPVKTLKSLDSDTQEESTYRALIQELDQEREKRWKAEQAEKKLRENIKELQNQAKEEKGIQSMAVYTTDRLKELVLRERNVKTKLQMDVQQLKDEVERLSKELDQSKHKEEVQQKALQTLEETLSKLETQRVQRQASERKQIQAAELRASAAEREVQLLRISLQQQKEKVEQVHELLMLREQEHRKELETKVTLNGSEFQEALSKEVAREQQRHEYHIKELQGKNHQLNQNYKDLEDEFRIALTIEAKRFTEVKEAFDSVATELADHKHLLVQSQQKEKQSATLIHELTSMVKEQKVKITEIVKSKQERTYSLRSQIRTLENTLEEYKQKTIQLGLLKQEKSKLISQITAQESVIDGLKAERKIWGQELAQQGASLAQDRGKLEAKIEVLTSETEALKKQNERNNDALKIKSKIVEDQTETIRKLKEALQERDEQIRKYREESTEIQKTLQVQLEERDAQLDDLMEKVERQNKRKEELKQQLQEKETELEDIKKAYSVMNKKWQDKGGLLSKLEAQVKQMKENFDIKEKQLIEERDRSLQAQKTLMEKMHSMDDAFRRQLESTLAAHQAELLQLANEKQQQIAAANGKVYHVEEEMRQLLQETANNKKAMEDKIKRLTAALSDIQQEF
ncbi:leucine-rich repeat and coiled-coil domain-containing protein 1 isoform X2 [Rhineura floridana]|uniref:leucine-rich repeat and coiled-coil domain-containing protein 1 isoform X2 n=1 Tax=Rhineura floridana TaxID=261503 RepID=UPI002AC87D16|nr:leucine-rich repeat and coiled-coil domain-containing protein 1 isoform X2 [Rhineura floridana]XP_061458324.1 leucine-rich repeat and coiled-coil domain-containing protein 1 isoform X2 [Rhineura floridana]XP_061458332.1 leucine-rich repeat and coiled-coil domain-containing protein 1 isoform X2 [Rhineura floridana]XP_061458342.1 leucine-rich repeat and coiled-coil domain-containing protein 1 isoform X2 [Rhineura floridana]XP_061458351.1 leucine-rich repeat and coiled-coil domain-containing pr